MATSQRTQVPIDPAPNVSDKDDSGWAETAERMHELDKQEVKDWAEDIDSVLFFAGLYSAVLTAFLVESVQNLQPNPSMITVVLLSQLVTQTQSYAITSGFLNSTTPPLDVSAVTAGFQPSTAAKRVNVLWFASLMLALISASFGFLVKQWLRQYLKGQYVSPQAMLRVRYFRVIGLLDWQVYTIAAMLPLVLQVALALFFVGLCFFTLDIHNSIGYTTIPLVGGWGLLFVAALFAPSLSPRCPYKLSPLQPIMSLLRQILLRVIVLLKGFSSVRARTEGVITRRWTWNLLAYNEYDAAATRRYDVDILAEADKSTSQTNDELFMKMCRALQEGYTDPDDVIEFVVKAIGFRLRPFDKSGPPRPVRMILDLSQLPVRTSTILMDTVAETLRRELRRYPPSQEITWKPWMADCAALLVAKLPCQLSDKATGVLSLCSTSTHIDAVLETLFHQLFIVPHEREDICLHLLQRLRDALLNLDAAQLYFAAFCVVQHCHCTCDNRDLSRCSGLREIDCNHSMPPLLWDSLCELFSAFLLRQLATEVPWSYWHRDMVNTVLDVYVRTRNSTSPWHEAFFALGHGLATNHKIGPQWYPLLYNPPAYSERTTIAFCDIFTQSEEKERILKTMHSSFTDYVNSQLAQTRAAESSASSAFILHLLMFLQGQHGTMKATVFADAQVTVQRDYLPIWQQIWQVFHRALGSVNPQNRTYEQSESAMACLFVIDDMDTCWLIRSGLHPGPNEHFEHWAQTFPVHMSFFSDQVIKALMVFLPSSPRFASKRVCRIRWLYEPSEGPSPTHMAPPAASQPMVSPDQSHPLPSSPSPSPSQAPPLLPPPSLPSPPPPQFSFQYPHDLQEAAIAMQGADESRPVSGAVQWPFSIHVPVTSSQNNHTHGSAVDTDTRDDRTVLSPLNTTISGQENVNDSGQNGGEHADANAKPSTNVEHPQSTSDPGSCHDWQRDDAEFSHPGSALSIGEIRADGDNNLEDQSRYKAANGDSSRTHDQPDPATPAAGQY